MGTSPEENKTNVTKMPMLHDLREVCTSNVRDTIAYVVLALGLFFCFLYPFAGGLLVGGILGFYFSDKAFEMAKKFKEFLVKNGFFKGFVVIAANVALLILAPGLSIGFIAGVCVHPIILKMAGKQ